MEKRKNGGCFLNGMLTLSLLALAVTLFYYFFFFAENFETDPEEIVISADGGEEYVNVITDALAWRVSDRGGGGVSVSKNGKNSLRIYVGANTGTESRTFYVTIETGFIEGFGRNTKSIKITQKGKQATYMYLSDYEMEFSQYRTTKSVDVYTNCNSWYVEDCPDWIITSRRGNTLSITADSNPGAVRYGYVTINADNILKYIRIKQE